MATEIIVDGYNLIGSEAGLGGNLEHKRNSLVRRLGNYQQAKGYRVTVVFDGWRSGWMEEVPEKHNNITVVYSRQGEKADSVVVRLARQRGGGCVVVTSDREVRNAVERFGAVALYADDFREVLRNLDRRSVEEELECGEPPRLVKKGNPKRLSKKERKRRDQLKKLRS
jgi:predicted RNA-binding protein with PIN domain